MRDGAGHRVVPFIEKHKSLLKDFSLINHPFRILMSDSPLCRCNNNFIRISLLRVKQSFLGIYVQTT